MRSHSPSTRPMSFVIVEIFRAVPERPSARSTTGQSRLSVVSDNGKGRRNLVETFDVRLVRTTSADDNSARPERMRPEAILFGLIGFDAGRGTTLHRLRESQAARRYAAWVLVQAQPNTVTGTN